MSIEAWPFLVSRNPYLDYRTIVAPDFICAAGIPNLLARAADGELTDPGHAIRRKVEGSEVGDFSIVFRVVQALEEYINFGDGENLLRDSFGREIYLLEGLVIKGISQVSITNEDLEGVHTQVRQSYQKFWDCTDVPPVETSSHSYLKIDEFSEALNLLEVEEMQPLVVNSEKTQSQNSTWKLNQKLLFNFRISSIAFSPRENKIAVRSYNPFVEILSLTDHRSIDSIDRKLRGVLNFDEILNFDNDRAISFSSDGKLLAFSIIQGADKNNVLLWNINLRKEEYIFKGHRLSPLGRIHSIAFSKVGNLLASASQDSTVKLWNTATGEQYASLENAEPVYSVSFSPKGSTLVSGSSKGSVEFWDVEGKCRLDILKSKALSSIKSLAFSSDGSTLAVGGDTVSDYVDAKYVEIWDINEKKIIHVLDGHSDLVYSVAFSPDGQLLASGSKDGNVKLWNVKSGKETLPLPEQSNGDSRAEITSVAFSSDGKLLASSHMDGVVTIWRS